jgi:hypothetical protein
MLYFSGIPAGKIDSENSMYREKYKLTCNRFSRNVVLRIWTRFIWLNLGYGGAAGNFLTF